MREVASIQPLKVLFLFLGTVLLVAAPLIVLLNELSWLMSMPAVIAGAFLLFLANLEKFVRFKAGPLEAELRDAVRTAYATIDQLKETARLQAKTSIFQIAASHFIGGSSISKKLNARDEIIQLLKELGVPEAGIRDADAEWRNAVRILYFNAISHETEQRKERSHVNPDASPERKQALQDLSSEFNFFTRSVPSPKKIRQILDRYSLLNAGLNQLIEDYAEFEETGELTGPRRDRFLIREDRKK